MRFFPILFLVCTLQGVRGQFFLPDTTLYHGLALSAGPTSRQTNYLNLSDRRLWGLNCGVRFGEKRHKLAVSYNFGKLEEPRPIFDPDRGWNLNGFLEKEIHLYSFQFYYNILDNYRFRLAVPLEVGWGSGLSSGTKVWQKLSTFKIDRFSHKQVGVYLEWKATRYLGLNYEYGKRWTGAQEKFEGAYYGLGLNLYLFPLYKDIVKRKKTQQVTLE